VELQIEGAQVRQVLHLAPHHLHEVAQARLGRDVGCLERLLDGGHIAHVGVLDECEEEVLLVLEVGVHRALGEARRRRDLVERGLVEPPLGEDLGGGPEQVLAGLLAPTLGGEWL